MFQKYSVAAAIIVALCSGVIAQQLSPSIEIIARGGSYYRVYVDGVEVSKHTTQHKAQEKATNLELEDPTRNVEIRSENIYDVNGTLPDVTPEPDPDPTPDPDPEPDPDPDPTLDPEPEFDGLTPANLEMVGGFRLPSYYGTFSPTAAFAPGNFAIDTNGDDTRMWMTVSGRTVENTISVPMGAADGDPKQWPLMNEGQIWKDSELFGTEAGGYVASAGVGWDDENHRLFISTINAYNTIGDKNKWIAAIDFSDETLTAIKTVNPATFYVLGKLKQPHSGNGISIISQSFADAHLGGKRLGFLGGGYKSGQGSALGPTFSAMDLEPSDNPEAQRVMYWQETSGGGSDDAKNKVERIFPEYGPVDISWQQEPDDTDGDGVLDTGYWGASSTCGGSWVKVPGFEGMVIFARQATGEVKYSLQSETFASVANRASNLYVYTAEQLAKLADNPELDPWSEKGKFYRWDSSNNGGLPYVPRGTSFDPETELLWVYYEWVWGSGPERQPIIVAYRFKDLPVEEEEEQAPTLSLQGGFKVPAYTINGTNTRYLGGSWDLRDGKYWINKHGNDARIAEYEMPDVMGTTAAFNTWPELVPTGRHSAVFLDVDKIGPSGVHWLTENTVLCSGRKSYRSGYEPRWMTVHYLDTGTDMLINMTSEDGDGTSTDTHNFHRMQAFGSGFMKIPQEFADKYTNGRTIAAGRGGYDVLGSPLGPAFAALDINAVGKDQLQILVDSPQTKPAPRSPNYVFADGSGAKLDMWLDPVGDGPTDGRWIAGDCGNPTWIPGLGVLLPAKQIEGTIDYRAQGDWGGNMGYFGVENTEVFYNVNEGPNRGNHQAENWNADLPNAYRIYKLYFYPEKQLKEVAEGTRDYTDCIPQIIDFPIEDFTITNNTEVIGLHWDEDSKTLWACLNNMWNDGKYAIMAAYKINEGNE